MNELFLYNNQIEDITLLCKCLENNSCLKILNLSGNQIEDKKCFIGQSLIILLKFLSNSCLKYLSLSYIQIENITLLCKCLENNSYLEYLNLCCNNIKDITLLKFLLNSCLKELNLSNNNIKDITPLKFLENNSCLRLLYLFYNPISKQDKQKIWKLAELKHIKLFI